MCHRCSLSKPGRGRTLDEVMTATNTRRSWFHIFRSNTYQFQQAWAEEIKRSSSYLPLYHCLNLIIIRQVCLVYTFKVAPKIVQTWPWLFFRLTTLDRTPISFCTLGSLNSMGVFARFVTDQVISCAEPHISRTSWVITNERFCVAQNMFPVKILAWV